jgi:hypothetical protein
MKEQTQTLCKICGAVDGEPHKEDCRFAKKPKEPTSQDDQDQPLDTINVDVKNPYADKLPKNLIQLYNVNPTVDYEQYGASTKVLSMLIQQLGLKYLGVKLEVEAEMKFAEENISDVKSEFDEQVIHGALRILHESKGNPTYFDTHQIDDYMQRPVNILNNIVTRKEEAEKKTRQLGELMTNIRLLKKIRKKRSPFYFVIDLFHKIIYR